jgi:hypothetical protein
MAGNGAEWTSEVSGGGRWYTVTCRGRDYHKEQPLLYSDLLAENQTEIEKQDRGETSEHIGFRIILTPAPARRPCPRQVSSARTLQSDEPEKGEADEDVLDAERS